MNLDNLHGKELDKYGASINIPRYQGLSRPESDEDYRNNLKKHAGNKMCKTNCNWNVIEEEDEMHAVIMTFTDQGVERNGKTRIGILNPPVFCYEGSKIAIYDNFQDAENYKLSLERIHPGATYEIRSGRLLLNNK